MKSIALLAAAALMSCSLAFAQEKKPEAAKPAAAEAPKATAQETAKPAAVETAKPAAVETAKPTAQVAKPVARAAKSSVTVTKKVRREEDARHCLGRPSNNEIIKCAEAYL